MPFHLICRLFYFPILYKTSSFWWNRDIAHLRHKKAQPLGSGPSATCSVCVCTGSWLPTSADLFSLNKFGLAVSLYSVSSLFFLHLGALCEEAPICPLFLIISVSRYGEVSMVGLCWILKPRRIKIELLKICKITHKHKPWFEWISQTLFKSQSRCPIHVGYF